MTGLDRLIQRWRIAQALRWIPQGARVCDIGTADGALFRQAGARVGEGIGIDPDVPAPTMLGQARLVPGLFPAALPRGSAPFDVITLLAVLEHVPREVQPVLARDIHSWLRPGGRVVITVPSPFVDRILDVLRALRLVDGMSLEQHFGFDPSETPTVFGGAGLRLVAHRTFQLGLNHLFVFERPA